MRTIDQVTDTEREKLEQRAKAIGHGATSADILASDELGMDAARYVAFKGARSIHAMQAAEDRLAAEAKARADAQAEILKDQAKAAIRAVR